MSRPTITKTGGREATEGLIEGDVALAVGMPTSTPPAGWRWTRLTDLARLETGHTPSRRKPDYWAGKIPWIGTRDATANHGRTILDTSQHVSQLGIDNSSARILPPNTVCLSRTASVGYVVVMGRAMATSQDFVNWICDESKLDYRFLKYALLAENRSFSRFSHGTTHQTIYFPEVKAFHVCVPPVADQRALADVLTSLDDKIEQNRRTSRALEELARATFKAWFVDFEPVKAKAAGVSGFPGMPSATFATLPNRFTESRIGPTPHCWQVGSLEDILELQRGFDLPKDSRREGPYPVLSASGINGYHDEYRVKGPGVTTGRSGVLGRVLFCDSDFWPLNTSLWVKEYRHSNPWHAYYLLQSVDLSQFNAGSAVPTLNRNHLRGIPVVVPSTPALSAFAEVCGSLFTLRAQLETESLKLAELRDYLLPRLLSGRVRVRHSEGVAQQP